MNKEEKRARNEKTYPREGDDESLDRTVRSVGKGGREKPYTGHFIEKKEGHFGNMRVYFKCYD